MKIDYRTKLVRISGETIELTIFRGKVLLIVNTASHCGYTRQYAGLQRLYERYSSRGFEVLGFPCNQFGRQEPWSEERISSFCHTEYQVSFPMFAKIRVNGAGTHPLYGQLKKARPGFLGLRPVKWNFTKFLIARNGEVLARYGPRQAPRSFYEPVETALSHPVSG